MVWTPKGIEVVTEYCHKEFLRMAYSYALSHSDDNDTRNGSVLVSKSGIVLNHGANRFPVGVKNLPERLERPLKYSFIEHAERDVILTSIKYGVETRGAILYCPWYACADCGRAIISAGIESVIGHEEMMLKTPERWQASIDSALEMLHEAGVVTQMYRGKIGRVSALFNGISWEP